MQRQIAKDIRDGIIGKMQAGERVMDLAEQSAVSPKTIDAWLCHDTGEWTSSCWQQQMF